MDVHVNAMQLIPTRFSDVTETHDTSTYKYVVMSEPRDQQNCVYGFRYTIIQHIHVYAAGLLIPCCHFYQLGTRF